MATSVILAPMLVGLVGGGQRTGGVVAAQTQTVVTEVSADARGIKVWAGVGSDLAVSREPDGRVLVRQNAASASVKSTGACAQAGATGARCPATVTKATVTLANKPNRLVVEPGARLAVAVFGDQAGVDDNIDLRGATASQVTCGAGHDTVQAQPPLRIWGDCEEVNGAPWLPRTVIDSVQGAELDAAPGAIAWIDATGGRLHLQDDLTDPGHTLAPRGSMEFRHLDVGLDGRGRPVATVAECRGGYPCRWLSIPVASGRRSTLRLNPPSDCRVVSVARWRSRTAMGVRCRSPHTTNLIVRAAGRWRRLAFPDDSNGVRAAPAVDLRGNLLIADLDGDGYDDIWAMRLGRHPCRRLLDLAASEGDTEMDAGRAHIVSSNQVLWSFLNRYLGNGATWGNLDTVRADCKRSERYVLPDRWSAAMTIVGETLVREHASLLTSEPLITVPPPLWAIDNPYGD